jgi:hypothetical protein
MGVDVFKKEKKRVNGYCTAVLLKNLFIHSL